jgi:hypothetical protein
LICRKVQRICQTWPAPPLPACAPLVPPLLSSLTCCAVPSAAAELPECATMAVGQKRRPLSVFQEQQSFEYMIEQSLQTTAEIRQGEWREPHGLFIISSSFGCASVLLAT